MPTLAPTVPMSSWSRNLYSCSPSRCPSALPQLHATRWSRHPFTERAIDDVLPATDAEVASDAGTTVQDPVERRIAAGLSTGDRQALADAFAEWGVMIHAFCVGRVGHGAADDLTQQVFVAAWGSRSSFDPDRGVVPGWLIGIARNLTNRSFRTVRELPTDTVPGDDATIVASAQAPSDQVDELANRMLLGDAMQRLAPDQRRTLALGYLEDLTQQEVADRLDMPLGTVKSHQRRGLQQLRTVLGGAS